MVRKRRSHARPAEVERDEYRGLLIETVPEGTSHGYQVLRGDEVIAEGYGPKGSGRTGALQAAQRRADELINEPNKNQEAA